MRRPLPVCRSGLSVLASLFLLAGCGGSDEEDSASESPMPASESTARNPVSTLRPVPAGMNVDVIEKDGAVWFGICSVR